MESSVSSLYNDRQLEKSEYQIQFWFDSTWNQTKIHLYSS